MKRLYLLLIAALVVAFVGCQPDTPNEGGNTPTEHYVKVESDTLYLGSEASIEPTTFYIDSHDNFWTISYDESVEWCTVSDILDEDGMHVVVVETTANETDEDRELTVTVTNGNAAAQFVVKQLANQSKPATEIKVAEECYKVTKEMTTLQVEVESDGDYTVVLPEECDWVSYEGSEEIDGKRVESFYVSGNFSESERAVDVRLESLNASTTVRIFQWGSVDLKVDREAISLLFFEGRDSIRVESGSAYTAVVTEGEWLSINSELSSTDYIVFDYTENTSESEDRTATITLTSELTTKEVVLTQVRISKTERPKTDMWAEDFAAVISNVEASTKQSDNRGADKAADGNDKSYWCSATRNTKPQELSFSVDASMLERVDYLRYTPTSSITWGRWHETDIYVTDADGVETLKYSGDLKCEGGIVDVTFDPALPNTITKVRVVINSATPYVSSGLEIPYVAAAAEVGLHMTNPDRFAALDYFTDWSLSELRPEVDYAGVCSISDPFYRSLAENLLYGDYNTEFRVCKFRAYPKPERDADILRDKPFGVLDNVTGMFVKTKGDTLHVYLDEDYGLEIYVRVVDYINNEGSCCVSTDSHGYDYRIRKGRNVIIPKYRGLMYIIAATDNYANIPEMKAHFVDAEVNGYLKEGVHTAEDVYRIFTLADRYVEPRFDIVTSESVLNFEKLQFHRGTFENNPRDNAHKFYELVEAYDTIMAIQKEITGLNKYSALGLPRQHRNRMLYTASYRGMVGFSGYYRIGFDASGSTMVEPQSIWKKKAISFSNNVVGSVWCLAHELGHSTQTEMFTWCGLTEVTNNLMCAISQNVLYGEGLGRTTMRYNDHFNKGMKSIASRWVWDFDEEGNWFERPFTHCEAVNSPEFGKVSGDVDPTTRLMPFYQLYLYYHLVKGNRDFYPDFYEVCRTKDFKRSQFSSTNAYQSALTIEFVKSISEVSGENLSDWAQAWGIPGVNRASGVNKGMKVNHYSEVFFLTTEEDVAGLKEYCSKFPKPELDLYYLHDLNLELYRNPQPVTAGTHTVNDSGTFKMEGWQNVAAWLLVDPDKTDENGEQGRVVAVVQCDDVNSGGSFKYVHQESRYIPKDAAAGDYSDYWYNNGSSYASSKKGTERGMEATVADIEYTKSLQLYAVDVYGKRYASGSNTR